MLNGALKDMEVGKLDRFLKDLEKVSQSEGSNITIKVSNTGKIIEITDKKTGETTTLEVRSSQ